jgi:hypothetical protein
MPKQPVEIIVSATPSSSSEDERKQIDPQSILVPVVNEEQQNKDDDEERNDPNLLRPYKRLDPTPIIKRVNDLRLLHRLIQSHQNNLALFTDDEKKELEDHIDNLKYVAIAENHFPTKPSVLSEKETGAISLALEMTLNPRYAVVFGAIDFLALATNHPLCAQRVLNATDEAIVRDEKSSENAQEENELKASTAALNLIGAAMLKYKNKNELQLTCLDLLQNLVSALNNINNQFLLPTIDILQSQAMIAVLNSVSIQQQKHNNDNHFNGVLAEKVCRFFQLLVQQRPNLFSESSKHPQAEQEPENDQSAVGPSTADIFANVGDVLPTILRLGSQFFEKRPRVAGPVVRILSHMAFNSHELLATTSTASSLLAKILKHYSPTSIHSITLDCIRALSQLANHYLPLQIDGLILQIRGVMTSNGNVEVLTTCVACLAHLLRIVETEYDIKMKEYLKDTKANKEDIESARKDMRRFLELLQKEAVPFVGAAHDHFAEEFEDLGTVADAFLRQLGERIRNHFMIVVQYE